MANQFESARLGNYAIAALSDMSRGDNAVVVDSIRSIHHTDAWRDTQCLHNLSSPMACCTQGRSKRHTCTHFLHAANSPAISIERHVEVAHFYIGCFHVQKKQDRLITTSDFCAVFPSM